MKNITAVLFFAALFAIVIASCRNAKNLDKQIQYEKVKLIPAEKNVVSDALAGMHKK